MIHPVLVLVARAKVRQELRDRGHSFSEALQLASQVDAGTLGTAVSVAPPEVGAKLGALGDGSILQAILAFLESDLGQTLIKILLSLLLAA